MQNWQAQPHRGARIGKRVNYISDYFTVHVPARTLCSSSDSKRLTIPRLSNSITGDKRFYTAATKAWNSLSMDIKSATATCQFKSMLKTHLFSWTILLLYAFCVVSCGEWCLNACKCKCICAALIYTQWLCFNGYLVTAHQWPCSCLLGT